MWTMCAAGAVFHTLCFGAGVVLVCTLCFDAEFVGAANGVVVSALNPGGGNEYSDWLAVVSSTTDCDGGRTMGDVTDNLGAVNGYGSIANMVSISLVSGAGG